jgi:hypothetical protein
MYIKAITVLFAIELTKCRKTVNGHNPRSILGREAETILNNYKNKVKPSGEH